MGKVIFVTISVSFPNRLKSGIVYPSPVKEAVLVATLIAKARGESRTVLTEVESKQLLSQAGIDVVATRLAVSKAEAVDAAKELGFPVVLKIASADITHKSDAGGVKLGLEDARAVEQAYDAIMQSARKSYPRAEIRGVAVQKMARPGVEVIIGMSKDEQFGPVIMFGLGGILVEVLKDVSFRLVPLAKRDAAEMVREIKGYPVLEGYRGQEAVKTVYLEKLLLKVSDFVEKNPEVKELDLNPIFAYSDGALAVDARVILEKT
jgi:acyl-CoA synthetase (NDP forming)